MGGDEAWTLAAAHRSVGVPRLLPAAAAMAISTVTHWETENALGGAGGAGGGGSSCQAASCRASDQMASPIASHPYA